MAEGYGRQRAKATYRLRRFTPTEAVAMGRRLEDILKPAAAERKREGRPKITGVTVTPVIETNRHDLPSFPITHTRKTGKVRDVAAAAVGMSGPTYALAKQVVESAERDPEKYGDLPAKMDSGDLDSLSVAAIFRVQA